MGCSFAALIGYSVHGTPQNQGPIWHITRYEVRREAVLFSWRGLFGFFQGFRKGRHDFKDVANQAVIRDFENRRIRILVDGHDGVRAFHTDNVLDRAADAEREIKLWGDGLAGAADLALHGDPAFITNGTRSGDFRAKGFRKCLRLRDIFRRLDAAANGDDERRLREVYGGFGFLEKLKRLGANLCGAQRDRDGVHGSFARRMRGKQVRAESARLKRSEPRRGAGKSDVGGGFALEHLAHEDQLAAFVAITDAIADHAFAHHGSKLGSEVADLIGMRKQNKIGLGGFDHLFEGDRVAVGSVSFEQIVLDAQDFGDIFRSEFVGKGRHAFADDEPTDRARTVLGNLLRRSERLETRVVPFPLPLFGNDENFHGQITRASNLSFSTSFGAISLGLPVRNSVFFVFVGT